VTLKPALKEATKGGCGRNLFNLIFKIVVYNYKAVFAVSRRVIGCTPFH